MQPAGPGSRRMLAVFEVEEADDLSRAMSRLFAAGSPWREKLAQTHCFVRYAVAPSTADRRAAATALKNWLSTQREAASQVFESKIFESPAFESPSFESKTFEQQPVIAATEQKPAAATGYSESELTESGMLKTVAERAVDRVTHGIKLSKAIPAGF